MQANDATILLDAAKGAGDIALSFFGRSPKFWEKEDDQGPVSEADLAVNEFLVEYFSRTLPDHVILSEESEDDPARLGADAIVVIDPIDGTKAYLNGEDFFAVSIAIVKNGEPHHGVVYAPKIGDIYLASKGKGATLNGEPMAVSNCEDLTEAKILASRAGHNRAALDKEPKLANHFRPSIALRLALVACGKFDLTVALRPSWDWDLAAGDLLVREAGGMLLDRTGNLPNYNNINPQQNGIVAGPPNLVKAFLNRIEN